MSQDYQTSEPSTHNPEILQEEKGLSDCLYGKRTLLKFGAEAGFTKITPA